MESTSPPAGCEIARLPDDLLSATLARTAPRDACRAATVSPTFRAAADADVVWSSFLPLDLPPLANGELPADMLSKKQLFMRLSDPGSPVLLADGLMSMWLDRATGAKCYMLSARKLGIAWGDTPQYWRWIPITVSRFSEAAELQYVWWLEIRGNIDSKMLSQHTTYSAYIVFRVADGRRGLHFPCLETSVSIEGSSSRSTRRVFLDNGHDRANTWLSMRGDIPQDALFAREREVMAGWRWRWVSSAAVKATMVRFPSALRRRQSRRAALLSWALRLDPRSKWFDENLDCFFLKIRLPGISGASTYRRLLQVDKNSRLITP